MLPAFERGFDTFTEAGGARPAPVRGARSVCGSGRFDFGLVLATPSTAVRVGVPGLGESFFRSFFQEAGLGNRFIFVRCWIVVFEVLKVLLAPSVRVLGIEFREDLGLFFSTHSGRALWTCGVRFGKRAH